MCACPCALVPREEVCVASRCSCGNEVLETGWLSDKQTVSSIM